MDDKFLREFLKTGLFDIGEFDERLTWLKQAIADLQSKFEGDYSLLPDYTLVALDPNISDTEPILVATEYIITKHWEALRIRFTEMPRNIIRGVILNALNIVGRADAIAARIIYLTALNFFPYAKLNREKGLGEEMLNTLGEIAEKNALEEWSLIDEEPLLKLGTLKVSSFKLSTVNVDDTKLKAALKAASGRTPDGYDPYNHPTQWSDHFSKNASPAIATIISESLASITKSLDTSNIDASLNKFFADFKKSLDENLKAAFSSLTAVERRSKLLWWKETLYSPSQKSSYRGIDINLLPFLMAFDLNNQLPEITPISVDYLLRDTLYLLTDKQNTSITFSDYLSKISTPEAKTILKTYFETLSEKEGRISITDFIGLLVNDNVKVEDFKARTGIEGNETIALTDLAVAVLHDLLTQRIIIE